MNFNVLDNYDDVEIEVKTSNPKRKLNKKLRKYKKMYITNPTKELSNKIRETNEKLNKLSKKKVVNKKPKFKVKKTDKSSKYVEKKRKANKMLIDSNKIKNNKLSEITKINDIYYENKKIIRLEYLEKGSELKLDDFEWIPIYNYLSDPSESVYLKLNNTYSLNAFINIRKTIHNVFKTIPEDILKIIWKYYFDLEYYKVEKIINSHRNKCLMEKIIYDSRLALYK